MVSASWRLNQKDNGANKAINLHIGSHLFENSSALLFAQRTDRVRNDMAAFYSGNALNAIVGDIGQHTTKIGFAGEDYPRSYFRSNVAVIREDEATTDGKASSKT